MILEYHRPTEIEEVIKLLARAAPATYPMGGGSAIRDHAAQGIAVVDLQGVGLDTIQRQGNTLIAGATLTLQALADYLETEKLDNLNDLREAITHEATYNLRQVGTVAGTLVAAGGRSPFATALLALDANLKVQPGDEMIGLGDLLPLRDERLSHRLITQVTIPVKVRLAYAWIARSPQDIPIVCAAVASWPSGRTRAALGGFGSSAALVFDGTEADGCEIAAQEAYSLAEDEWASAEYRMAMAGVLVRRCICKISESRKTDFE